MVANGVPTSTLGSMASAFDGGYGYGAPLDVLEHIPELTWPQSIAVFGRMRTDATVESILSAYITAIIAANWSIDPTGCDPRAVKICTESLGLPVKGEKLDEIGAARRRGVKFIEHLRLASLNLLFGHMAFETVYEVREDGFTYLAALPERMPSTINEIKVNSDGTLKSIVQDGLAAGSRAHPNGVEIPADRLLFYVNGREGAVWTGRSLIRSCYSYWLLKLDTMRVNAVGIARFGAGTPVMEALPGFNPTPAQTTEAQRLASAVRVGQSGGAAPVGFTLRIKGVEGALPDALPTLQYYDAQMQKAALTSLMDLGNTSNGSRALGDNFADVMHRSLQSIADRMAETASQLCVRLTNFNLGEDAVPPRVVVGDVGASKATIATTISGLIQAGAITPDAGTESYMREAFNLPTATPAAPVEPTPPAKAEVALAASGWQPWVHAAGGADAHSGSEAKLVNWYVRGEGAARIRWGTAGDFDRCRAIAGKYMPPGETAGFCANRHKEATGQWPGKSRVHAAEPAPPAQTPPPAYREPTPQEQAAGIDPQQIDAEHEDLVAEGLALFAAVVLAWGAALTAQILAALTAGSLVALARLKLRTGDAVEALQLVMHEAASVGVRQVLAETERAGARSGITEADVTLPLPELDDTAEALAEHTASTLAGSAGREAARLGLAPDETAVDEMLAQITTPGPVPALVSEAVARAMASGRTAAMASVIEATPGIDWEIFASAVRDGASCSECLANDGRVYPDLAAGMKDFPLGLFKACLGRTRCRCLLAMRPVKP